MYFRQLKNVKDKVPSSLHLNRAKSYHPSSSTSPNQKLCCGVTVMMKETIMVKNQRKVKEAFYHFSLDQAIEIQFLFVPQVWQAQYRIKTVS